MFNIQGDHFFHEYYWYLLNYCTYEKFKNGGLLLFMHEILKIVLQTSKMAAIFQNESQL